MAAEQRDHLICLTGTHQACIHKHTSQLIADRLMDQNRSHRAIHPAGQAANHAACAHLFTNGRDRLIFIDRHGPAGRTPTNPCGKIAQQTCPALGMDHFGVKLDRVIAARLISDGGKRCTLRTGNHRKSLRQGGNMIAMAHPDGLLAALRPDPVK